MMDKAIFTIKKVHLSFMHSVIILEKSFKWNAFKICRQSCIPITPYTTSIELVDDLREVIPDSLNYVIKDMFETITLYENRILKAESKELESGKYQVDLEFRVSKYRNDEKGKMFYGNEERDSIFYKSDDMRKPEYSVYLEDYIDVGVFGDDDNNELYLKKHKITSINNKLSIILDEKPAEVGIDPYNKLIDTNSDDNRKKVESL